MCNWLWKPKATALPPVDYIALSTGQAQSVADFIEQYLATRAVDRDDYNRGKLLNAIQQYPGGRPADRDGLTAYLDKRYRQGSGR